MQDITDRIDKQRLERQARLDAAAAADAAQQAAVLERKQELDDAAQKQTDAIELEKLKQKLRDGSPLTKAQTRRMNALAQKAETTDEDDDGMTPYQEGMLSLRENEAEQEIRDFILNADEESGASYEEREVQAMLQNQNPRNPVVYVPNPPRTDIQKRRFLPDKVTEVPGSFRAVPIPPALKQIDPEVTGAELLALAQQAGMEVDVFIQELIRRTQAQAGGE